jgi:hypothetical protein
MQRSVEISLLRYACRGTALPILVRLGLFLAFGGGFNEERKENVSGRLCGVSDPRPLQRFQGCGLSLAAVSRRSCGRKRLLIMAARANSLDRLDKMAIPEEAFQGHLRLYYFIQFDVGIL